MVKLPISALEAECVIFDLDGTLVDTAPDLLATLNVLFTRRGHREITLSEIRTTIGHGARAMIREGGALTGNPFADSDVEKMFGEYLEYYSAHIADHSTPFPGAIEVLEACRKEGVKLAICTNKLESLTHPVLEKLEIKHYFDVIIGFETLAKPKPDALPVREIMKRTNAVRGKTLYVGDSKTDLDTARAAGVAVVLVDFGYTPIPARELGADAVISDLRDLL